MPFDAGHDSGEAEALALVDDEVERAELAVLAVLVVLPDTLAADDDDTETVEDAEELLEDPAFVTSLAPQMLALLTAAPRVLFR